MKKVLLTATVQSHIAQFHKPLINMLKENGYEVHVAAKDNLAEKNGLKLDEPDKIFNIPFDRSPLSKNNILAYSELNKILSENKYNIVHCNTPMGGLVTRLAANKYRKKGTKVFYTAHGFHFYKGAPKKNWFLYYPIEKIFARLTDKIITITKEDFDLANKRFNTDVVRIHGVGANSERFFPILDERMISLREELGYQKKQLLILCIGELNQNKNQEIIIKAIFEVIKSNLNVKLLLAGNGPNEKYLRQLTKKLKIEEAVEFLGYRTDLERIMKICDVVVSASYREGLPLNIMEAMLCAKPVIASRNRGHRELIADGITGYLFDPNDVYELKECIFKLLTNPNTRIEFGKCAIEAVIPFKTSNVLLELKEIYD